MHSCWINILFKKENILLAPKLYEYYLNKTFFSSVWIILWFYVILYFFYLHYWGPGHQTPLPHHQCQVLECPSSPWYQSYHWPPDAGCLPWVLAVAAWLTIGLLARALLWDTQHFFSMGNEEVLKLFALDKKAINSSNIHGMVWDMMFKYCILNKKCQTNVCVSMCVCGLTCLGGGGMRLEKLIQDWNRRQVSADCIKLRAKQGTTVSSLHSQSCSPFLLIAHK